MRSRIDELKKAEKWEAGLAGELDRLVAGMTCGTEKLIDDQKIKCGVSGTATGRRSGSQSYVLTQLGSLSEKQRDLPSLRRRRDFVNFLNVQRTGRMKILLDRPDR